MSVKDKLEIGLKPDAPYRPDNLPEHQKDDPDCQKGAEEGESAAQEEAREDCAEGDPRSEKTGKGGQEKP
jgi:hypothetical protein